MRATRKGKRKKKGEEKKCERNVKKIGKLIFIASFLS